MYGIRGILYILYEKELFKMENKKVRFTTNLDEEVLRDLKSYCAYWNLNINDFITDFSALVIKNGHSYDRILIHLRDIDKDN